MCSGLLTKLHSAQKCWITSCLCLAFAPEKVLLHFTVVSTRRSATLVWEPRGGNCMCLTTRMWASAFFKKTFPLLLLFIAAVWLRSQEPQSHSLPPPVLPLPLPPWKVNSFNLPQLKSSLLFTKCLCCCREMVQWILLTMHCCTALKLFSDCSRCL